MVIAGVLLCVDFPLNPFNSSIISLQWLNYSSVILSSYFNVSVQIVFALQANSGPDILHLALLFYFHFAISRGIRKSS